MASVSTIDLTVPKDFEEGRGILPPEVRLLFRREQQVASIVYRQGAASAKDVECQIPDVLANASVRSMLNRLVDKGILLRSPSGSGKRYLYTPALTESLARQRAIQRFADDFCEGSLSWLVEDIADFIAHPRTLAELLDQYELAAPAELRALAGRMREIADVVYRSGMANGRDIPAAISGRAGSGVRTLLGRLVARRILRKRRSGRHRQVVYLPAILTPGVRRLALKHLIDQRFEGSPQLALQSALHAMRA